MRFLSALLCLSLTLPAFLSQAPTADQPALENLIAVAEQVYPGAPSGELLLHPKSARIAGEPAKIDFDLIGTYNCLHQSETIACFFVYTRGGDGVLDYNIKDITNRKPRLIDNFRIEHNFSRSYYLNGRGQQQETVNLDKGESTWLVIEFDGGAEDISEARILIGNTALRAQIKR